ncbi:MAG: isocitrate lyase/PEP mutase family protein [Chromatiales bacterium]|nr:isocitrate lyase/PEP mutase family protein [Chromatiales bacterium]
MTSTSAKRAALAARVRARDLTIAPGVYDMMSARIADRLGFTALYMTGYGVSASHLGLPDAGLATYTDMVSRAGAIAQASAAPLIADADTGYGGLLNVRHSVRGYEAAGVAAIQIEDQEFPKKCGHTPTRRVIPLADMERKIRVAVEARTDPDFLIVARTDARTGLGLDEAIRRGRAFAAAGADVVFVESPESEDEFARVGQEIDAPLLANMVESGRSPVISEARLRELGFSIAIYPASGFTAASAALDAIYRHLRDTGSSLGTEVPLYPISDMHTLMGFQDVWAFDQRWADEEAR